MPALPDFFVVMRYLRAYDALHRLGKLSPAEVASIEADGRPFDRLPAPDLRVGHDEPDGAARRVAGVGGEGAAEPPAGRASGRSSGRRSATTTGATGRSRTRRSTTACGSTR
ncbi:MAG: hypothetical protein MZV64_43105 [Ignavibacteriales bacterium]|nr:hypothetical protein [Ignavibacteriales bacterium]